MIKKINGSKFFYVFLAAENESDNKIWHLAIILVGILKKLQKFAFLCISRKILVLEKKMFNKK